MYSAGTMKRAKVGSYHLSRPTGWLLELRKRYWSEQTPHQTPEDPDAPPCRGKSGESRISDSSHGETSAITCYQASLFLGQLTQASSAGTELL